MHPEIARALIAERIRDQHRRAEADRVARLARRAAAAARRSGNRRQRTGCAPAHPVTAPVR